MTSKNEERLEQPVKTRYPQSHLAACVLPWTELFELDVPRFERHVQSLLDDGYRCLYVMGTAGEGFALNDARYRQVVTLFAGMTVREGIDPQVGVISLSMAEVIDRIGFAYDLGVRMFQVSLPSWGPLDDSETTLFFKTVCGTYADCRFLHYNLPRAGRILSGADYRCIIAEVPNLVATKNSTTDYARTADLMRHAPQLQHFLLETNYAFGCTMGECSFLCSLGALCPKTSWQFYEAGREKNLPELFRLTRLFREIISDLFSHCSRTMIDSAYDKTFQWLRDSEFSTRLLPPYIGLNSEELDTCRAIYEARFRQIQ